MKPTKPTAKRPPLTAQAKLKRLRAASLPLQRFFVKRWGARYETLLNDTPAGKVLRAWADALRESK